MNSEQLRDSILQFAIKGKLVPQNPNDEPANELLKRIATEKEQMILNKLIKKETPLPPVNESEIPFDIPITWEWVRLSDICSLVDGVKVDNVSLPYLEAKYIRGKCEPKIKSSGKYVDKNQYVILVDGENSGEVFLTKEEGILGSTFKILYIYKSIYDKYLINLLKYYQKLFRERKRGAAIPHLDKNLFKNLLVGLPPLEEQKRIVSKIEKLMQHVEKYDETHSQLKELNSKFTSQLEKSILLYAMQGKMVEQNLSDESAQQLIEKIKEKKEQLIQDKVIKKEKPLLMISEEEKPFDIPDNWKWVRLGDVVQFISGYAYKSGAYVRDSKFQIIRLGNVKKNKLLLDVKPVFISEDLAKQTDTFKIKENDILVTMTGTKGKKDYFYTCLVNQSDIKSENLYLNQRVGCIRPLIDEIGDFLIYILQSPLIIDKVFEKETGTANQGNLGIEAIRNLLIPLPPIEMQKRIVSAIGDIMCLIEKFNKIK